MLSPRGDGSLQELRKRFRVAALPVCPLAGLVLNACSGLHWKPRKLGQSHVSLSAVLVDLDMQLGAIHILPPPFGHPNGYLWNSLRFDTWHLTAQACHIPFISDDKNNVS